MNAVERRQHLPSRSLRRNGPSLGNTFIASATDTVTTTATAYSEYKSLHPLVRRAIRAFLEINSVFKV